MKKYEYVVLVEENVAHTTKRVASVPSWATFEKQHSLNDNGSHHIYMSAIDALNELGKVGWLNTGVSDIITDDIGVVSCRSFFLAREVEES